MAPIASVIVPIFNVADMLEQCVRSLLEQTLHDIEVILVDDGSTDHSPDICDAFARRDSRVVVIHQENRGLSAARNSGLAVAQGTWVAFLDGDDWTEPAMLTEMVSAADTTTADVVVAGCFVDVQDDEGQLVSTRSIVPGSGLVGPGFSPPALTPDLVNLVGYAWNKLFRREALRQLSAEFTVGLSLVEDMVFNAAVLTHTPTVALVDRSFVHYVQRPRESLGSAFHPDFLGLRLQAIEGLSAVLEHWGAKREHVLPVVSDLRIVALYNFARFVSERPEESVPSASSHYRDARRGADEFIAMSRWTATQRVQVLALRRLPARVVVVGFRARRRLAQWRAAR